MNRKQIRRRSPIITENLEPRRLFAADLFGNLVGTVPAAILPGARNKLTASVQNQGDVATAGPVGVALFASTDQTLDETDIAITSGNITKAIAPGKHVTLKFTLTNPPAGLADGNYYIITQVDTANAVAESDETNNANARPELVGMSQPFVDLSVSVPALPVSQITVSPRLKPAKGAVIVTNNGNVPARGTVTVSLSASTDSTLDGTDMSLPPAISKAVNLKPGKAKPIKLKVTLPQNIPSGSYFLLAGVDASALGDSNTANNSGASPNSVNIVNSGVQQPPLPDPALSSTLELGAETILVGTDEQISFLATVANTKTSVAVEVVELDANGAVIGKVTDLYDDGNFLHGDATAGDGLFNGSTAIGFFAPGSRRFVARFTDSSQQTTPATVTGVQGPDEARLAQILDSHASQEALFRADLASGIPAVDALAAVKNRVLATPDTVRPDSIEIGEETISWQSTEGITMLLSANAPPPSDVTPAQTFAAQEELSPPPITAEDCGCSIASKDLSATLDGSPNVLFSTGAEIEAAENAVECKKAILIEPFNWWEYQFEGEDLFSRFVNKGWSMTRLRNATSAQQEITPEHFKGLQNYGAVMIVTHIEQLPRLGTVLNTGMKATTLSSIGYASDLISERLVVTDSGNFGVTNRFIRRYTGKMNESIVYIGNGGETDNNMASAFLHRGAAAVTGYNGRYPTVNHYAGAFGNLTLEGDPVPVRDIAGPDHDPNGSPFVFFGDGNAVLKESCNPLRDSELVIEYSWINTQRDLDTSTHFLDEQAGYSCGDGSAFLSWTGDNTSSGGKETVVVNIADTFVSGRWSNTVDINLHAGWYASAGGSGPALVTVALRNKLTGEVYQTFSQQVSPGTQSGCATTPVGRASVQLTRPDLGADSPLDLRFGA